MIEVKSMKLRKKHLMFRLRGAKIVNFFWCSFRMSSLAQADSSQTSVSTKGHWGGMVGNLRFAYSKNCHKHCFFHKSFQRRFWGFFLKTNVWGFFFSLKNKANQENNGLPPCQQTFFVSALVFSFPSGWKNVRVYDICVQPLPALSWLCEIA